MNIDWKAELLKYINLEAIAMELIYDKILEDVVLEKLKELIPGEIDDAIIDGMKPMLRPLVETKVKELIAKLQAE